MSVEALKEQARRHEQNEQWQKALDLYIKAMDRLSDQDAPDIGLFNRAGDLATRTGASAQAVSFYEKAVDYYVEAELPNNAIAVCKKVMRNLPDRYSIHLKMGQIRAAQGFITDARSSFVTYAERVQAAGDTEEAFRALIEFVDLAPDDHEIRLLLGPQLAQHERGVEAVLQLSDARHIMMRKGLVDEAAAVEAQILEIDPNATLGPAPMAGVSGPAVGGVEADRGFAVMDFDEPATAEVGAPAEIEADFGGFDLGDEAESDEGAVEEIPVAVGGLSLGEDAEDDEIADSLTELPLMSFADDEDDAKELPRIDEALVEVEASFEESDAGEAVEAAMEESLADAPAEEAASEHGALAAKGDFLGAIEALSTVVEAEPDEQPHHQRMVEYAFRSNDSSALAEAYAGLAECLQRAGQDQRAKAVFEQALTADPANERAKAGLGQLAGETAAGTAQEVSSAESYVDLGSMLLGDEAEKTTRFVVAYEEPTGDESADFQKMLSQFPEKVSENIGADDATAHHDLGTAFREMGLLDEAIAEYQQALRASADHLPTYELLGQTFLEKNEPEAALRSLTRALDAPFEVEDELMGIYYYLAMAHETVGNKEQAVEFYDRVFSLDINFADVTERLRALRG